MTLVANARMYAVNAAVAERWRELFAWVATHSGVALEAIDHPAPSPLSSLWRRADLGAATMCGFPLASWRDTHPKPVPIAAAVPSPASFAGRAAYWTDIVVRADALITSVDELAGTRFGWTAEDSQSGYQAPRAYFAARAIALGGRFFASTAGPLVTPRRVVESVIDGSIDAGPLDSYWHALLSRHEPDMAAQLRVVASTPAAPIPCFVAAAAVAPGERDRLAQAFVDAANAPELAGVLRALALARFERVDVAAYATLLQRARDTDALGYTRLA